MQGRGLRVLGENGTRALSPGGIAGTFSERFAAPCKDVRTPAEFAEGHVEGAKNAPIKV